MSEKNSSAESGPDGALGLQPWIRVSSSGLAATMTFVALLWNIDFF